MTLAPRERPSEGLRERKRQETLQRITAAGLKLFLDKGYDETTLDEIAAAAGIARRTFFYYLKSKEDILLALQASTADLLGAALRAGPRDGRPIDAVFAAMLQISTERETGEALAIDRLLQSTETLRTRKQAGYIEQENALFETLCELWPDPALEPSLRTVAMVAMGAMRIAVQNWRQSGGARPPEAFLREAFATLRSSI